MDASKCPTLEQLSAFVLGTLSEPMLDHLGQHLEECKACEQTIESLESKGDEVLSGLRRAPRDVVQKTRRDAPLPEQLGDYRIIRELGRGGMGIVFEAEQVSLGRRVALKVLPAHFLLDAGSVERFKLEARAAARLHHTNIVQVYGTGEQDGLHYFVMQYIQGSGLDRVIVHLKHLQEEGTPVFGRLADPTVSTNQTVPRHADERSHWLDVARIGAQIAEALAYAHEHGILHRDVKPSNLLLDGEGRAWLADFGLAKELVGSENLTVSGFLIGTLRYLPPERLEGVSDARGDVYGLGISLYESLVLRPAFADSDRSKLVQQILRVEPPRPRKINPNIPADLETIVLKAISRDPAHRYQTTAAMAEDLRLFTEDRPIRARRVRAPELLWRWSKRNPSLGLLAGGLLLSLLLGTLGICWKWWEAENAKDRSIAAERQTAHERDLADAAEKQSHRVVAGVFLQQGMALADRGQVNEAMFWMLEGLKEVPAEDAHLAQVVRTNLSAWQAHSHSLRVLIEQPVSIWHCTLNSDGRRLFTNSINGIASWDTSTGKPLDLHFEDNGIFLHSPDGETLVTSNNPDPKKNPLEKDSLLYFRNSATGQEIFPPIHLTKPISALAFTRDGKRLATGGADGVLRIYETASGHNLSETFPHAAGNIRSLDWSPDGQLLAVGTASEKESGPAIAYLWDVSTGKRKAEFEHKSTVARVLFSPSGNRLLTVTVKGAVQLRDLATREQVGQELGRAAAIQSAVFSPDGRIIATGGMDGVINWWDAASGDQLIGTLPRQRGFVYDLAFSRDGKTLAAVSGYESNGMIRIWKLAQGASFPPRKELGALFKANWIVDDTIPYFGRQRVAYNADESQVLSGSEDGVARLAISQTGEPIGLPLRNTWGGVHVVAMSPDGSRMATASQAQMAIGDVRLWKMPSGEPICGPLPHINWIAAMAFSPDGRFLATGGYDAYVHIWDAKTGKRHGEILHQRDIVQRLIFSPDGKTLAVGHARDISGTRGVDLWDVENGRLIGKPINGPVTIFCFSSDSKKLISAAGTDVRVWDSATGEQIGLTMVETSEVNTLSVSPNGDAILTGNTDGSARLWDANTNQPIGKPMLHSHRINVVQFSPDAESRVILAGAADGSARLWDRATQTALGPPMVQKKPLQAASSTPDGHSFVVTGWDGRTQYWAMPAPLEGDLDLLTLQLEARTGMEMGPSQTIRELGQQEWEHRRQQLESLHRSVGSAHDCSVDDQTYHEARARDSEAEREMFAARWHLDRLIEARANQPLEGKDLTSWLLYARRARTFSAEGLFERAAEDYRIALEKSSQERLLGWYRFRIVDSVASKKWQTALWYLERAISASPREWRLYADLAVVQKNLGKPEESQASVARAIELGADTTFLMDLAEEYALAREWSKAAKAYAQAAERGKIPHYSWEYVVMVLLKAGDVNAYRKVCEESAAAFKELPTRFLIYRRASIAGLAPNALKDYSGLIESLEQIGQKVLPQYKSLSLGPLGGLLYRAGQYQQAVDRLNECVAANEGQQPEDWFFLAMAHFRLGDIAKSKECLKKGMRLEVGPDHFWENIEFELRRREALELIEGTKASDQSR